MQVNFKNVARGTQNNNNASGSQEIHETNHHYHFHGIPSATSVQEILITHLGSGTSHTAERQKSLGYCLEGTREKELKEIHEWGSSAEENYPICLVQGPVGVGKSAIAMTICDTWEKEHRPFTSFFVRSDAAHNNTVSELILTLARGLPTTPSAQRAIQKRLSEDPNILGASLEHQFEKLILVPTMDRSWGEWLRGMLFGTTQVPTIIAIDGLDGCGESEGTRFLKTIRTAFLEYPRFPLRFFITSRSESYIREVFNDPLLYHKTKFVALDDNADLRRYFEHHLQRISSRSEYKRATFRTNPWPPAGALDVLVDQSCGQFAYASGVVSYIESGYPPKQLEAILDGRNLGPQSPFRNLDLRYHDILERGTSLDHAEILSILAAIIILPPHVSSSSACIELTLGLQWGKVGIALREMRSLRMMYSICGREEGEGEQEQEEGGEQEGEGEQKGEGEGEGEDRDEIRMLTSFKAYLVDKNRSGPKFYINVPEQQDVLARLWLQNLSASETRAYFLDGRLTDATMHFCTEWIEFCTSKCKPTRDLLDELRNIDLVFVFFCKHILPWSEPGSGPAGMKSLPSNWNKMFSDVVAWIKKNTDKDMDDVVRARLKRPPKRFHLELSPDVSIEDHAVQRAIRLATGYTKQSGSPSPEEAARPCQISFRLADCRCTGRESHDPAHLACQLACTRIITAVVEGIHSGADSELCGIFEDLVDSSLLQNCRLERDLLLLCQDFFEAVASNSPPLKMSPGEAKKRERKLLKWIEASTILLAVVLYRGVTCDLPGYTELSEKFRPRGPGSDKTAPFTSSSLSPGS
ncbi:hypothetical protein PQX77_020343 [Marasmius sp. AFHP31]|nr:hypothetical protein PQX77_020343 [Marasmius sp. AFHP31]